MAAYDLEFPPYDDIKGCLMDVLGEHDAQNKGHISSLRDGKNLGTINVYCDGLCQGIIAQIFLPAESVRRTYRDVWEVRCEAADRELQGDRVWVTHYGAVLYAFAAMNNRHANQESSTFRR